MSEYKIVGTHLTVFRKGDLCPYAKAPLTNCKFGEVLPDINMEEKVREMCNKFRCRAQANLGPVFWYDIVKIMKKRVVRD